MRRDTEQSQAHTNMNLKRQGHSRASQESMRQNSHPIATYHIISEAQKTQNQTHNCEETAEVFV